MARALQIVIVLFNSFPNTDKNHQSCFTQKIHPGRFIHIHVLLLPWTHVHLAIQCVMRTAIPCHINIIFHHCLLVMCNEARRKRSGFFLYLQCPSLKLL